MTHDDIQELKDLLNDESDKWRLDVGDWMAYVEELVEEVERLRDSANVALGHLTGGMDGDWRDCDLVELLRSVVK